MCQPMQTSWMPLGVWNGTAHHILLLLLLLLPLFFLLSLLLLITLIFPPTAVVQTVVLTPRRLAIRTVHLTAEAGACGSVSQRHLYQPHPPSYISLLHPETGKLGDSVPRPQFGRSIRVRLRSRMKAACPAAGAGGAEQPSAGTGAPAALLIPAAAGKPAGETKKIPFRLDQQTRLADCVAASLLVLAQRDRGASVCVGARAHARVQGRGRGGAGGGRGQGDCGSQFKWIKLHPGLRDGMRWFKLWLRGAWVTIRNISSLTWIAVLVISQGRVQGFLCAITLPESGGALFYSEYI